MGWVGGDGFGFLWLFFRRLYVQFRKIPLGLGSGPCG